MAANDPDKVLFVTGNLRSGTTLLERLIASHSDTMVLSQPFPLLYVELKRAFLKSMDMENTIVAQTYPLSDMMGDHYYPPDSFIEYLSTREHSPQFYQRMLTSMINYSGRFTKYSSDQAALVKPTPERFIHFLHRFLNNTAGPRNPSCVGCKEVFCEEFIPFFLDQGIYTVMILRDPRDVITSLNFGQGRKYTGKKKPHLFNIRCWRKSVAFALAYRSHPRLCCVYYEDLVRKPERVMERVTQFLGITSFTVNFFNSELTDQEGNTWLSNSSHASSARITTSSIGLHRKYLSKRDSSFIEACCLPELKYLGYPSELEPIEAERILTDFEDESPLERVDLSHYIYSPERRNEELARLNQWRVEEFSTQSFIFRKTFDLLTNRKSTERYS